jgi:predicted permease
MAIVAPVFLLASIGFGWCKLGYEYPTDFITRLVMTLAVPCLIFTTLIRTEIDLAALSILGLASFISYGAILAGLLAVIRISGLDIRSYLAPLVFGNTGNLGLPLALFAFGEIGLGYGIIVFAVMAILAFTIGVWLVSGRGSLIRVLKDPIVIATLIGTVFLINGWGVPVWMGRALDLIGQVAIPLMLITLGVAVARLKTGQLGLSIGLSLVKFALCLGVGIAVGRAFGLDDISFGVLVLQLVTPVAVTSFLLAEKYHADADAVAGLVVVSTLISVMALPVILSALLPIQ